MTRPYQDCINKAREQLPISRAWAQECFDEYMETLAARSGPLAINQTLHQTRLHILLVGMNMANSWVDYWMGSIVNYTKMQQAQERIETIMERMR